MKITALAIGASLFCSPANANFSQWCVDAYDAGNIELGKRMAEMVQKSMTAPNWAEARTAIRCLRLALGSEYKYLPGSHRIVPADEYETILESERLTEEAERQQRSAEEAERQRLLEQRAELEAGIEMARRARQDAVLEQLAQSCTSLFRSDPDTTITNKLCYDYFYAVGLPD